MLTIPKLIAAIYFAALGYFCGDLIKPLLPEGANPGWLNETLAAIGAVSGWKTSGRRAGFGTRSGLGYGLTTAGMMTFWGIFLFSGEQMLQYSIDKRYQGPMEALKSMVGIMLEFTVLVGVPTIIGTAIIGGLFGGWLTEWVAKRWN